MTWGVLLQAKQRVRFFQLADVFLSSGMVPAYTAAAFAKRFARLALMSSPAGLLLNPAAPIANPSQVLMHALLEMLSFTTVFMGFPLAPLRGGSSAASELLNQGCAVSELLNQE